MTIDQFIQKYDGVHINEDGYYGAQCWDVAARYAREVVGCPSFPTGSGGAEGIYRFFTSPINKYFTRVANDKNNPDQLPPKGAIIVWNGTFSAPWGHIAVVINATQAGIDVLEQNGDNPGGYAYITKRTWHKAIDGWLVPIKGGADMAEPLITKDDIDVVRIAHSEIGGWPLDESHAGIHDGKFMEAWGGKTVRDLIRGQWKAGEGFRAVREQWRLAFEKNQNVGKQLVEANAMITDLRRQIDELDDRATPEQVKALKDAAEDATKKAMAAQAELEQKAVEDASADKGIASALRALWRFITNNKENK